MPDNIYKTLASNLAALSVKSLEHVRTKMDHFGKIFCITNTFDENNTVWKNINVTI